MLDASRSVPSVEGVKEYIRNIAALGMNMLMLYTEDTYKMDKYPYFGHQLCGYSLEELNGIDAFADGMGVEVIPCIQTLGHLETYLRWQEAAPVKNSAATLLVGAEHDFQPMIWSDMYFSLGGNQRYDYDENVAVASEVVKKMVDVGMVFWDYYHDYQNFYDVNIEKHQSFGKEIYFAGGVWDFDGFAPNFAYSLKTMRPALTACVQKGVRAAWRIRIR